MKWGYIFNYIFRTSDNLRLARCFNALTKFNQQLLDFDVTKYAMNIFVLKDTSVLLNKRVSTCTKAVKTAIMYDL